MSMNSHPLEGTIFYIDSIAAAFIHREIDRRDGTLSKELAEMSDEEFLDAATQKTIPDDYYDLDDMPDCLGPQANFHSEFDGHVETKYPELSLDCLSLDMADNYIVYFSLEYCPSLLVAPYESREAILEEFKDDLGGLLPENYDWWRNICDISGTYFC